jgi:WD40 repeat protein
MMSVPIHVWTFYYERISAMASWNRLASLSSSAVHASSQALVAVPCGHLGVVHVYHATDQQLLLSYGGHTAPVEALAFSPNQTRPRLASSSLDRTVQIWHPYTGALIACCEHGTTYAKMVCWSPDAKQVMTGGADGIVRIFDAETGKTLSSYQHTCGRICDIAWFLDDRVLSSTDSGEVLAGWWTPGWGVCSLGALRGPSLSPSLLQQKEAITQSLLSASCA